MRRLPLILMVLMAALAGTFAADDAFEKGRDAYDQGLYTDAAEQYQSMLDRGMDNVELRYNLANALFKSGDLPHAVWNYRTAWYVAPRDPDINANLRFALNAAGAIEPAPSMIERFFTSLSSAEWVWVAIGSYLALSVLLVLGLLVRYVRPALLKLSLIPVTLLLVAAGGWWQWYQLNVHPEAVLDQSGATALFAPLEGSTAHFKVPPAALVCQLNTDQKGWIEIEYDGKNGWIKKEQLIRISP